MRVAVGWIDVDTATNEWKIERIGTVEFIPGQGLVFTGDGETLRDLVDECRADFAYGREWRILRDEEIPEHLLMRFRRSYTTHVELLNDDGTPAAAEVYQPIYAKWRR